MTTTVSEDEADRGIARTLGLPVQPHVTVEDHGTIIGITPLTQEAREWLSKNAVTEPWQWLGGTLMVDRRFAGALLDGLEEALE